MDKTSLSRSNSSSSLDQFKEEEKKDSVTKNADSPLTANDKNDVTTTSGRSAPATMAMSSKLVQSGPESASGWHTNYGSKNKLEIKNVILPSSDPILSPRASSAISLGSNRSVLSRTATNNAYVPSVAGLSSTNVPAITLTTTNLTTSTTTTTTTAATIPTKSADQNNKNSPGEIASALIKAETAVEGVPYKKQMTSGTVARILREGVEDKNSGVNLIATKLVPFVEKQFGTSEYGNLFRDIDKRFLQVQPEIENLRNTIKSEMQNPIEFTDKLMDTDPRLAKLLDPVISPLIQYVIGDDTIKGSNLPAPFMQLLKGIDNEILTWQKVLSEDAKKSGGKDPVQADVDIARKNAMLAMIGIRSLSVMQSKLHGGKLGGPFLIVESYLIRTIKTKCVSLIKNIMSCPNDKFEALLTEKRGQQIKRKHSMKMNAPEENSEKLSFTSKKQSQLAMSPRGPVQSLSELEIEADNETIEHNKMLLALFVKKYKLSIVDDEFSFQFQKKMSQYIDEGGKNLSERAVKKECLTLMTSYMKSMKQNGQQPSTELEHLYQKLAGYSFGELEEEQNPNRVASPKSAYLKKQ